jgi:hypothetical protein
MIEGMPTDAVDCGSARDRHHNEYDVRASNATAANDRIVNRFMRDSIR